MLLVYDAGYNNTCTNDNQKQVNKTLYIDKEWIQW